MITYTEVSISNNDPWAWETAAMFVGGNKQQTTTTTVYGFLAVT